MHKAIKYREFAYNHDTFTKGQIKREFGIDNQEFDHRIRVVIGTLIPRQNEDIPEDDLLWRMNDEALFEYLEYKELNEARQSSKSALARSTTAICISILIAAISIGVQFLPKPEVVLSETQYSGITKTLGEIHSDSYRTNQLLRNGIRLSN